VSNDKCIYAHVFTQFMKRWSSIKLGVYNFENDRLEFLNEAGQVVESKPIR
jgi:hypothetical protein